MSPSLCQVNTLDPNGLAEVFSGRRAGAALVDHIHT